MTGLPLSSRSTRSLQLKGLFPTAAIVCEESLGISKLNLNEKQARQQILSRVEQLLSNNTVVIVDYLNYIKGFRYSSYFDMRYQLYVIARGLGTLSTVVYCASTLQKSLELNKTLKRYNDNDIMELSQRFFMISQS